MSVTISQHRRPGLQGLRWLGIMLLLAGSPLASGSSASQRARGAAVFTQSGCQHCHSMRGVGGTKGPDLSRVGRRLKVAQMRQQIVNGSKVMPAFGDILQETELSDLITYLRSCRDKK